MRSSHTRVPHDHSLLTSTDFESHEMLKIDPSLLNPRFHIFNNTNIVVIVPMLNNHHSYRLTVHKDK